MFKIETTSKVSLEFTSRINLGRRGARAEHWILDIANEPPNSQQKAKAINRRKNQFSWEIFQNIFLILRH